MQIEMEELETNPEGEMKELALIYIAKGIPESQAHEMAAEIMKDKTHAHDVLVKEELGINAEELKGSAVEAAIYSFILFAIGAVIPVIPFIPCIPIGPVTPTSPVSPVTPVKPV